MKKRISFLLSLLLLLVLVVPTQASTAANPLGVHAYIVQEDGTRIPIQSLTIRQTVPTDFSQARLCALNDETYYEVIAAADVVRDASGTDRLQESNYFNDADFTFYAILNVAYKDAPTQLPGMSVRVVSHSGQYVRKTVQSSRTVNRLEMIGTIYAMDLGPNGTDYESGALPAQYEVTRNVSSPSAGSTYTFYPNTSNYFWTGTYSAFVRTRMFATINGSETAPIDVEISGIYYGP